MDGGDKGSMFFNPLVPLGKMEECRDRRVFEWERGLTESSSDSEGEREPLVVR